jgi:pyruvate/oxaloacetate carboxyltransferase
MSKKIQFVDVTLRDGQQCLAATRMTTEQALRVVKMIEDAGFAGVELWGGATLDNCIRFLDENPWERLDKLQEALSDSTKSRAVLRGQNLFGYQPSADDLVIAFVKETVKSGVGGLRIYDALNDWRNLQTAIIATRAYGAVAEVAISYTTSPVHTNDYFVDIALKLEEEGADMITINDMAGLLTPTNALELIKKLKDKLTIPVALHGHTTTGMGTLSAVVAMQEGVDHIDTAITPFAGGTSLPPIEVLVVFAEEMGLDHGLNKEAILKAQKELFTIFGELQDNVPDNLKGYKPVSPDDVDRAKVKEIINLVAKSDNQSIEQALPLMQDLLASLGYPKPDKTILKSHIPGGMLSNLYNQLKENNRLDILDKILEEIPLVRQDAGYVPVVTPTSQVIASQATFNAMSSERYKVVSNEFRMLLKGEFGRLPGLIDAAIVRKVFQPGDFISKYRPASYLQPVLEDEYDFPFIKSQRDKLLYLLFKRSAEIFLRKHYGLDNAPPDISDEDWDATPQTVRQMILSKMTEE